MKFTVDLHFKANGTTSEFDEYLPRYFGSDKAAAVECFEYARTVSDCAGAALSAWDDDYIEEIATRFFGSYCVGPFTGNDPEGIFK